MMNARLSLPTVALLAISTTALGQGQFSLPNVGKLPRPTQMHGSAIIRDRLYIFGGETPDGWSNEAFSAPINANATIGQWRQEAPLPDRRNYLVNNVEVVNDRIYVIGGNVAAAQKSPEGQLTKAGNVVWTTAGPDGTLAPWKSTAPMPGVSRSLGASCSTDTHLIVTGGSNRQDISNEVLVADITASGEPQNWRRTTALPDTRWFHAAAILENRVYVWAGLRKDERSSVDAAVYSAPLQGGGTLGAWRSEAAMSQPTYNSTCCALNDHLVTVGGRYSNKMPTNDIWSARLQNGQATSWNVLKSNLSSRVYHSLAMEKNRGWVFINGGKDKTTPEAGSGTIVDTVQAFQLTQPAASKLVQTQVAGSGGDFVASLDAAATAAALSNKPVLAYFYSPEVPACKRAWDTVINTPDFKALSSKFVLAAIDVISPQGTQDARKATVLRVPALHVMDARGGVTAKTNDVSSMAAVQKLVGR